MRDAESGLLHIIALCQLRVQPQLPPKNLARQELSYRCITAAMRPGGPGTPTFFYTRQHSSLTICRGDALVPRRHVDGCSFSFKVSLTATL